MTTPGDADARARRRQAVVAGHADDAGTARRLLDDGDPAVRLAALGALARLGTLDLDAARTGAHDVDAAVRRRTGELLGRPGPTDERDGRVALTLALLDDDEASVAEVAAAALGELLGLDPATGVAPPAPPAAVPALAAAATSHPDALCRESAVAALGAIGHPDGLPAVLAATGDKPAVRRRAVIALAAFVDHDDAVAALRHALDDRDWQVRDAAAVLLEGLDPPGPTP